MSSFCEALSSPGLSRFRASEVDASGASFQPPPLTQIGRSQLPLDPMELVDSLLLFAHESGTNVVRQADCSADSTVVHVTRCVRENGKLKCTQEPEKPSKEAEKKDIPGFASVMHEVKVQEEEPGQKKTLLTVPVVAEYARKANIQSPCYGSLTCSKKTTSSSSKKPSDEVPFGSFKYMCVCGLAGSLCCGVTHLAIVPLDLIKCRIQVDTAKYPNIATAAKVTIREEGLRTMVKGWAPTAIGYGLQGFGKFGFYEVYKKFYGDILGAENAYTYRTWIYLAAASSAEAVADTMLAPFEAVKVRMQTVPGAPSTMRKVYPMILRQEGISGLYKGLGPLWMRQIPYTASKFVCFERAVEFLYKNVVPKKRDDCTKREQLMVTSAAAVFAGIVCVICSHPPDVIVSKLYKEPNATIGSVVEDLGVTGMWKGLYARILMIGSIAAAQLFIVDSVKVAFKLERPPPPEMPASLAQKMASLKNRGSNNKATSKS